ncbi:MBL fold metallo-hydrolase [Gleimia hominis]|uniref:MBL fold metallo-hydrolase n=1 Tax=Gleimia hominis TaxID=595468 RepID=A0ABU3IDY0_9ACTO|nr:MBL fold metallo-hydrolase [Gleimia hominis]MDT3767692.1 MBL fold metallo-hydrolase [Gleimia hominis]
MRIRRFEAELFAANAYVVSAPNEDAALIVDPGLGVTDRIKQYLHEEGLTARAVLLTHGHADHVWECANFDVPVYITNPDRYRLEDPLSALLPQMRPQGVQWRAPQEVRDLTARTVAIVPGVNVLMVPAPGHTEGSALFLMEIAAGETLETNAELPSERTGHGPVKQAQPIAFTGDVIFAGSVGRADLPGGDERQMRHTLRTLGNVIDPRTWMLPGHGPATHWEHELATNLYVRRARSIG